MHSNMCLNRNISIGINIISNNFPSVAKHHLNAILSIIPLHGNGVSVLCSNQLKNISSNVTHNKNGDDTIQKQWKEPAVSLSAEHLHK